MHWPNKGRASAPAGTGAGNSWGSAYLLIGKMSSFSPVSTTKTASRRAGSVALAFSLTSMTIAGIFGEAFAGAVRGHRPIVDLAADRSLEDRRIDEGGASGAYAQVTSRQADIRRARPSCSCRAHSEGHDQTPALLCRSTRHRPKLRSRREPPRQHRKEIYRALVFSLVWIQIRRTKSRVRPACAIVMSCRAPGWNGAIPQTARSSTGRRSISAGSRARSARRNHAGSYRSLSPASSRRDDGRSRQIFASSRGAEMRQQLR